MTRSPTSAVLAWCWQIENVGCEVNELWEAVLWHRRFASSCADSFDIPEFVIRKWHRVRDLAFCGRCASSSHIGGISGGRPRRKCQASRFPGNRRKRYSRRRGQHPIGSVCASESMQDDARGQACLATWSKVYKILRAKIHRRAIASFIRRIEWKFQ